MGRRQALLVGIEHYGDKLDSLPVVHNDVALMRDALGSCGYATEVLEANGLNADSLGHTLKSFCEDCQDGDVHVIYFSGHGLSVDSNDYILPLDVSLAEALTDANSRVPTNLSSFASAGLVIFMVDACRDTQALTKGQPDKFGYETAGGPQFVRFFGCSSGETCQVVQDDDGQKVSMFTKALVSALEEVEQDSLRALLDRCTNLCKEFASGNLKVQKPRLSHGETTAEMDKVLGRRIFNPPIDLGVWPAFVPAKLHCVTITSESEAREDPEWTLAGMVKHTLSGKLGRRVWKAFRAYAHDRMLVKQVHRVLPSAFTNDSIQFAAINVHEAFGTTSEFEEVVRGVVEADLAVFDVSQFEPGMMLLMGIRSACRRGISIATVGGNWRELDEIDIPFNLRDLSLGSHAQSSDAIGPDEVTHRFVRRVEFGFEQMCKQPAYQDLPAYHALRQLGPEYNAASAIPVEDYVLVLVSYSKDYKANWQAIKNTLEGYLSDTSKTENSKVQRLVDLGNPQIVSQSLYEQIRRAEGCVADWTEYSPSTFFELGVRLAVSDWGVVMLVDESYLPGGKNAQRWASMTYQIRSMMELFSPLTYKMGDEANLEDETNIQQAANELATREPLSGRAADEPDDWGVVSRRISETMNVVEEAHASVFKRLHDAADALHSPMQGEKGAPQILFRTSIEQLIQRESEHAAMELRIAAWLYMHYRMNAGERTTDDSLRTVYDKLGLEASNALYDAGEIDFADWIAGGADPNPTEERS